MYAQRLSRALTELSAAIERYRMGGPFMVPASCNDFAEINHLLLVIGARQNAGGGRSSFASTNQRDIAQTVTETLASSLSAQASQIHQSIVQQAQDNPFQRFSPEAGPSEPRQSDTGRRK